MCDLCGSDPCICGDAYNSLTENGLLTLLNSLVDVSKTTLKGRNVSILVDGVPINEYIRSDLGCIYGDGASWLSSIESKVEIPTMYREFLEKHKGEDIRVIKHKLVSGPDDVFSGPRFPLVLLFYISEMKDAGYLIRFMDEVFRVSYFTYIYEAADIPFGITDLNDYWGRLYQFIGRFGITDDVAKLRKLVNAAEKMASCDKEYFMATMIFMAMLLLDEEALGYITKRDFIEDEKVMKKFTEACMGIDHVLMSMLSPVPLVTIRKI